MPTYCTDTDLLHYEPDLLREASFASQTLLTGTGTLDGTSFSIDGVDLEQLVQPGHVIVLTGEVSGCFPVVSVESSTSATLSVLHESFDTAAQAPPVPEAFGGSVAFAIRTYWPQRSIVSGLLDGAAGAGAARAGETPASIVNTDSLRRTCTLGTLQLIYSAMAAADPDAPHLAVRAELYERLYRRAIRNCTVEIDLDGDGVADARRLLNVLNLRRA